MTIRFLPREIVTAFALSLVGVACSAAPTGEGTDSTAEGILVGQPPPVKGPGPRAELGVSHTPIVIPPATCVSNPGCSLTSFASPGTFPVPTVAKEVYSKPTQAPHATCVPAPDFTAYLESIGCVPVGSYTPAGESLLDRWAVNVGFCPLTSTTIDDGVKWETMPCDECTGAPPNELWTVVAYTNPSTSACDGDEPSEGCSLGGCLPSGGAHGNL